MFESVPMNTNHHIAMQLAAERQRDLRASGGGWRFADMFARLRAFRSAPDRVMESTVSPRGAAPTAPAGAGELPRRRPEPRLTRRPAPSAVTRAAVARRHGEARERERVRF